MPKHNHTTNALMGGTGTGNWALKTFVDQKGYAWSTDYTGENKGHKFKVDEEVIL